MVKCDVWLENGNLWFFIGEMITGDVASFSGSNATPYYWSVLHRSPSSYSLWLWRQDYVTFQESIFNKLMEFIALPIELSGIIWRRFEAGNSFADIDNRSMHVVLDKQQSHKFFSPTLIEKRTVHNNDVTLLRGSRKRNAPYSSQIHPFCLTEEGMKSKSS